MKSQWPEHWKIETLENSLDALIDYRGKTPTKTDSGIPLITAKIVKSGAILPPSEFIAPEDYEQWMVRGLPEIGDVVITTEAPLGEVAQLSSENVALAQRIVTLRGKKGFLNNDFLLYLLQSSYMQKQLEARASGSTVKGIKQKELRKIELLIPPYDEQIKIACILKSIDLKIQVNQQINATLEAMAQALFKSWLVDFEPVKAKIAAKAAGADAEGMTLAAMEALSGQNAEALAKMAQTEPDRYAELKTTAELFPDALVDSELGEIPVGWGTSSIGQEFNIVMGQSPPGSTYNETEDGVPFFQGRRDFGWRYPSNRVYCTAPNRHAKEGDTLLSVRAPVGDINMALSDCSIGRGLAALRHKSGCMTYTFSVLTNLRKVFDSFDNEGTVFGSINQKNLKSIEIIKPCDEIVARYSKMASPLDQMILNHTKNTLVLGATRDSLLPKLLSGEVSVADV